jgi:hypothetical protein
MENSELKGWNHVPDVPLKVSPFFRWPLRPLEMFTWIWNSWLLITEKLIVVCIAIISFYWFQPPLSEIKTLAFGWIFEMYVPKYNINDHRCRWPSSIFLYIHQTGKKITF